MVSKCHSEIEGSQVRAVTARGSQAASDEAIRSQRFPFRVLPGRRFPALSRLPGQIAAQLAAGCA